MVSGTMKRTLAATAVAAALALSGAAFGHGGYSQQEGGGYGTGSSMMGQGQGYGPGMMQGGTWPSACRAPGRLRVRLRA
ncbi:MAG TPA: hypothetical protein VKA32_07270 [Gammaproteobacteria bacterium]|nr:hypothetical protein [Gammaproteobacteria bacterium]